MLQLIVLAKTSFLAIAARQMSKKPPDDSIHQLFESPPSIWVLLAKTPGIAEQKQTISTIIYWIPDQQNPWAK